MGTTFRPARRIGHDTAQSFLQRSSSWAARWLVRPLVATHKWLWYEGRPDGTTWWRRPEWAAFHSQRRWYHAAFCYLGPPSHILWNVKVPLLCAVLVSAALLAYHRMRNGCCPGLPALDQSGYAEEVFKLCSFALSLVLSMRLKAAFDRWWSARCAFAALKNAVVTLVMLATSFIDDPHIVGEFARWGVVWMYSIHQTISLQPALAPAAAALLDEEELQLYSSHAKPRFAVYCKVRQLVAEARLPIEHFQAMEKQVQLAFDGAGSCARLRFTPMPYGLTLFTSGFIFLWLLLLPFGVGMVADKYDMEWNGLNNMQRILPSLMMSLLMLGADEIANQLEDPWQLIPVQPLLEACVGDIRRAQDDAASWKRLRLRRDKQRSSQPDSTAVDGLDGSTED